MLGAGIYAQDVLTNFLFLHYNHLVGNSRFYGREVSMKEINGSIFRCFPVLRDNTLGMPRAVTIDMQNSLLRRVHGL